MAEALQRGEHHDPEQVADVQRRRRRVEPDVGGDDAFGEGAAKLIRVGHVLHVSAGLQVFQRSRTGGLSFLYGIHRFQRRHGHLKCAPRNTAPFLA